MGQMQTLKLPWDLREGEEINILKATCGHSLAENVPFHLLVSGRLKTGELFSGNSRGTDN